MIRIVRKSTINEYEERIENLKSYVEGLLEKVSGGYKQNQILNEKNRILEKELRDVIAENNRILCGKEKRKATYRDKDGRVRCKKTGRFA